MLSSGIPCYATNDFVFLQDEEYHKKALCSCYCVPWFYHTMTLPNSVLQEFFDFLQNIENVPNILSMHIKRFC